MQRKRIYNDVIISFVHASSISLFQSRDLCNSRGKMRVKILALARKEESIPDSQPSMAQCARMLYVRCGRTCTRGRSVARRRQRRGSARGWKCRRKYDAEIRRKTLNAREESEDRVEGRRGKGRRGFPAPRRARLVTGSGLLATGTGNARLYNKKP
jgi:hypothetical protein